MNNSLNKFIEKLPKAELHLHIEGSFEPELMFKIADRNKIKLKYDSIDDLKAAYNFRNLQEFLDIYYAGANVLKTEEDFYDLTMAYFSRVYQDNVLHSDIMFDPQTHTDRGVKFGTVINGIKEAQDDAHSKYGITSSLIMSFLRHLPEEEAFEVLKLSTEFKDLILSVGLDSSELGHPPSKFERVFKEATEMGYIPVAHAGEEGPAEYVWEAINILNVKRIDHGNNSLTDDALVSVLVEKGIPLTVCPLSNIKLKNVDKIENHPIKTMLEKGLVATINSDDPAYFGGYISDNYKSVTKALNLSKEHLYKLTLNSFNSAFMNDTNKLNCIDKLSKYYEANKSS